MELSAQYIQLNNIKPYKCDTFTSTSTVNIPLLSFDSNQKSKTNKESKMGNSKFETRVEYLK